MRETYYYYGLKLRNGLLALVVTYDFEKTVYMHFYAEGQGIEYIAEDVEKMINMDYRQLNMIKEDEDFIFFIDRYSKDKQEKLRKLKKDYEKELSNGIEMKEKWIKLKKDYEEALSNGTEIPYEIILEGSVNMKNY